MPNSLKCKIKHLCHNGTLTKTERDRILEALEQESCEDVPKLMNGKIILGGYDCNHYICSECGEDFGWYIKPNHKYCPNCGAKMEGVSE